MNTKCVKLIMLHLRKLIKFDTLWCFHTRSQQIHYIFHTRSIILAYHRNVNCMVLKIKFLIESFKEYMDMEDFEDFAL